MVKGDWHNVSHCTVFDGPAGIKPSLLSHSLPPYQDATTSLQNLSVASLLIGAGTIQFHPEADANTNISRNIFDSIQIGRAKCPEPPCVLPGHYEHNLVGTDTAFDIKKELHDPWNWDFRPCPGSHAAKLNAGAYTASTTGSGKGQGQGQVQQQNPQQQQQREYWIPGALMRLPSTPVPKHRGTAVVRNTDLMFLSAYRAIGHIVYFGTLAQKQPMKLVARLHRTDNVVSLGETLAAQTQYAWRVDAIMADGTTRRGDVWTFVTGTSFACDPLT